MTTYKEVPPKPCTVDDCQKKHYGRGFCKSHYQRWVRSGDTKVSVYYSTPTEALKGRTAWDGEHLLWTGAKNNGYGVVRSDGRMIRAHRLSYEQAHGPIPEGVLVDHICRIKACVNPKHLRLASKKQNSEHADYRSRSKSGYKGVFQVPSGRWRARVKHNGQRVEWGTYPTVEAAAIAVIAKRKELFTYNNLDHSAVISIPEVTEKKPHETLPDPCSLRSNGLNWTSSYRHKETPMETLNFKEAQERLGVSRNTLLKMLKEGFLPNAYKGGTKSIRSQWRIPASDVDNHMKPGAA